MNIKVTKEINYKYKSFIIACKTKASRNKK